MSDVVKIFVKAASWLLNSDAGKAIVKYATVVAVQSTISNLTRQKRPSTAKETSRVNVRMAEPVRWLCAGRNLMGGGIVFAEFDTSGNLWYVIVHCDSVLTDLTDVTYYLDSNPVSVNSSTGEVLTADFRLNSNKDVVTTDGDGEAYVNIWTTTYSASNPTPPAITALTTALGSRWTSDHKLVGTTYSVVKVKALSAEHRQKIYKWRGAIGMGEPQVSLLGKWTKCYDPRDNTQTLGTPSSYKYTRNPALIWAWFRTHRYGRNKSEGSINWVKVGEQADICDQSVTGAYGTHVRYQCGIAIPDDQERAEAEQDILETMDAQLIFDEDGKCWPRAGYYYSPTLSLSRNRDVIGMASVEAQNGENEYQGVIVRYTEPDASYTVQPSAPWYNPLYYTSGLAANFETIDIPGCQDHNQAMRLAKAIGMRRQPAHQIAPTVSLRGLRAGKERIANLTYDATFTGDYEIYTPVRLDATGIVCSFSAVPVDANRWTLLSGEEKPKPVVDDTGTLSAPSVPSGVTLSYADNQIVATFTPPTRTDVTYEFQWGLTSVVSSGLWSSMSTNMLTSKSYTGYANIGVSYSIRYRAVTSSRISAWSSPTSYTPTLALPPVQSFTATGNAGNALLTWQNGADTRHNYVKIYRGTTNVFGSATLAYTVYGGISQYQTQTDTISAGTYYWWIIAYMSDGTPSTTTGPITATVT